MGAGCDVAYEHVRLPTWPPRKRGKTTPPTPGDHPNPPAGLVAAGVLAATLAGTLAWLALLAGPIRLGTGLLGAGRHLDRAEKAISATAFKRARFETLAAAAAAERAQGGLAGPVVDIARAVPRIDRLLGEVPHLVAAARDSAAAAAGSLEVAQGALRGRNKIVTRTDDGAQIEIDRVEDLAELIAGVRARVHSAARALARVDLDNLPRRARPEVESGMRRTRQAGSVLSDAVVGFELLPEILGAEDRRLYLLAMQNSAELRGTGGSLLRFSMLAFTHGGPKLLPSQTVYRIDRNREQLSIPLPPDAWYVREIDDAQRFGNSNWSPDWPLSARLALRYAGASASAFPDVDGVIAVDPSLMREVLPGVGAFRTSSERRVTARKIVPFTLHRAYAIHPNPGTRRIALKQIVEAFYDNLLQPNHPTDLVQGLGRALEGKHMQIYLVRRNEMNYVARMGWDGAIEPAKTGDYLYVVEQNVGGNKLDYTSSQSHVMSIDLKGREARIETKVRVDNGVFLPQPNYWLGNSGPCHRPMLNVYVPGRAELLGWEAPAAGDPTVCTARVRRLDTPAPAAWSAGSPPEHRESGKKVWSATLDIPPGASGEIRFDYRVPRAVAREGGRSVYRLTMQHQPKVHPDSVSVALRLPPGASGVTAPGWHRRGRVLTWEHDLTRDVVLEVSWR